jgi:hypothetical protein
MRLKNLTVQRVLRLVLDESGDVRLGFVVEEGVLIVSTQENLARHMRVEIYDAHDLIESLLHSRQNGRRIDPVTGAWIAVQEEGGRASASHLMESLVSMIANSVEPDAWMVNGGMGSMNIIGRTLVVRQSDQVHRELRAVLDELRRVTASQTVAK